MSEIFDQIKVRSVASYLPGRALRIDEVDDVLGLLPDAPVKLQKWLQRMKMLMKELLEVKAYHFAIDPTTREFTDDNISMSLEAAKKALNKADMNASDIDLIVYGSAHQDQMPTASVRIQEELGIESCGEMAVHANCISAYKAMLAAYDMLRLGRYKKALVLSSNISSSELRAEYYNQPLVKKEELFLRYFLSDGAGAMILEAEEEEVDKAGYYLEHVYMESVGGKKPAAMRNKRPAYWMNPREEFENGYHHLAQLFNEQLREHFHDSDGSVFVKGLKRMIDNYQIAVQDVRFFQINFPSKNISELVMEECKELGIDEKALTTSMSSMGYVGPPMLFISLEDLLDKNLLKNKQIILSFVTEVSKFMQAGYVIRKHELA